MHYMTVSSAMYLRIKERYNSARGLTYFNFVRASNAGLANESLACLLCWESKTCICLQMHADSRNPPACFAVVLDM